MGVAEGIFLKSLLTINHQIEERVKVKDGVKNRGALIRVGGKDHNKTIIKVNLK
jgi:hypothetical protein